MHDRENALKEWLVKTLLFEDLTLVPLTGDASFRRYFRIAHNNLTQVIMDAPPEKENVPSFIHIAQLLQQLGILTPEILAVNLEHGFLLLSDLGDELLLHHLNQTSANNYYQQAMDILLLMQKGPLDDPLIPVFNQAHMLNEMSLCSQWFLNAYLHIELNDADLLTIKNSMNWLAMEVGNQPLVLIHRDFHSRNLMLPKGLNHPIGVIDFQDAMIGPFTYDLVSLLKDCYIQWPREKTLAWVSYFYNQNELAKTYSLDQFIRAFDLCGLQRHLKVLGIFSRLYLRDGKGGYLKDLPLTLHYVLECTELYPELHPLFHLFQKKVCLPL